jgi:hypothetical protein
MTRLKMRKKEEILNGKLFLLLFCGIFGNIDVSWFSKINKLPPMRL